MNSHPSEDIRNRLLVARLPTMPQVLLKLLALCQADEAGMAELAALISGDAGLTDRMMRVANSAAFHRSGRKVDLLHALNVLGADLVKTLVISESVFQTFTGFTHAASADLRGFWKHSLTAAVVAKEAAKAVNYPQVEEAYLAGLLHDVGRLALLAAAPEMYHFNFHAPDGDDLCTVEQRTLQISHAEAGAWLIERWQMDSFIADAVLYHHESAARLASTHQLVRLVHIAHLLSDQPPGTPLTANLGGLCNIPDSQIQAIYDQADDQVMATAKQMGIDLNGADTMAPPAAVPPPAPAVNRAQLQLQNEIRHRTLIAELAQALARQQNETQRLECILHQAGALLNLNDAAIFLAQANSKMLTGVVAGAQRQRLVGFALSLPGTGMAEAVLQRRPIVLNMQQELPSLAENQILRAFGSDSLLCIPMFAGSRCLGMLISGIEAWRESELKQQEKFLMAFCSQAARSLDTAATERVELDRRLDQLRQEHLQNSRKVAHEANNPLTIIKSYLGVVDDKLARHEPVADELTILTEEIDRVGNIIKEFAGTSVPAANAVVNLNRVVSDIVRLFRDSRFLPSSVQVTARVTDQPCEINGNRDTVKQILVNLIKNSVEAMPRGGQIEVMNHGKVLHDSREYFKLQIKDTGPGLPDDVLAGLFSPVRSRKSGENRGLGLSIVHGLVTKLGGRITCSSSPKGTSFEIQLPTRMTPR
ncbi:HDOD domain-containing protein [Rhodoferax sp.]|uniref:HDOD domain-containing protein n=1 Tax=Rhodoferax sp. TaxID=50421 RepID=UPI0025FF29D7|nr:HDOD domain-containing protein [Rhodoferax sp.]